MDIDAAGPGGPPSPTYSPPSPIPPYGAVDLEIGRPYPLVPYAPRPAPRDPIRARMPYEDEVALENRLNGIHPQIIENTYEQTALDAAQMRRLLFARARRSQQKRAALRAIRDQIVRFHPRLGEEIAEMRATGDPQYHQTIVGMENRIQDDRFQFIQMRQALQNDSDAIHRLVARIRLLEDRVRVLGRRVHPVEP